MAWFLRAVETDHGSWSCQWGALKYDVHNDLDQAVQHLCELAEDIGLSVVFVHPQRGVVRRIDPRSFWPGMRSAAAAGETS